MEVIRFSGSALRQARVARGYSQVDLAEAVHVTRQAISLYESGISYPTHDKLAAISLELRLPINFFTNEIGTDLKRGTVFHRQFKSATKAERDRADAQSFWAFDFYKYVKNHVQLPQLNLPLHISQKHYSEITNDDIESYSIELRKHLGLGMGPISNVTLLFEKSGVLVTKLDVSKAIDAFSFWGNGNIPFIFYSGRANAFRHRFNLCHEIGHLILHRTVTKDELCQKDILEVVEKQANRFAGAFLFPREVFCEEFYSIKQQHLLMLKKRWGVSIAAMLYRAGDLRIFKQEDMGYVYRRLGGKRSVEPLDDETPPEKPTIFQRSLKYIVDEKLDRIEEAMRRIKLDVKDLCDMFCVDPNLFGTPKNLVAFSPKPISG